jgi:hypothetical protein
MTTIKAEPHAYHNGAVASAVIDDVFSRNIDAKLQEHLLDLFRSAMVSISTTLAREAKFDTTDFGNAKDLGCDGFKLLLSLARTNSRDFWFGAFQRGDERLDVVGHLRLL